MSKANFITISTEKENAEYLENIRRTESVYTYTPTRKTRTNKKGEQVILEDKPNPAYLGSGHYALIEPFTPTVSFKGLDAKCQKYVNNVTILGGGVRDLFIVAAEMLQNGLGFEEALLLVIKGRK